MRLMGMGEVGVEIVEQKKPALRTGLKGSVSKIA
jgi:hypothetical protein